MYQIGIDIGGTNVKFGLIDEDLSIAARASIPFPHDGTEAVINTLEQGVCTVMAQKNVSIEEVESIGVIVPGCLDETARTVIDAHNLGFHGFPLCERMEQRFPTVPVYMANDADGAALAELYAGAFRGCKTAVLLTLGTGLGFGMILGGKIFTGGMHHGCEGGHALLLDGGNACTCGNHGCAETYCSAGALAKAGRAAAEANPESLLYIGIRGELEKIDAKYVTDCAKAGDKTALAVFNEYRSHLASMCASVFNLIDPEVLAIGGGLCAAGDFLFEPMQKLVTERCFFHDRRGKLTVAQMGNDAGIIGAAMLYRNAQQSFV